MHKLSQKIALGLSGALMASTLMSAYPVFASANQNLVNTSQVSDAKSQAENQVIVLYKQNASGNIKNTGLKTSDVSGATSLSKQVDVVTPAKGETTEALKNKIEEGSNGNVKAVLNNNLVKLSSLPNDVSGGQSSESASAYQAVEADKTWNNVPSGSQKVKVAVIDADITSIPEDLKGRMESPIAIKDASSETTSSTNHGIEVCSLIASTADNNKGIAGFSGKYDVDVVPYSCSVIKDTDGEYVDVASIIDALQQIINKKEAKIVNMSLSIPKGSISDDQYNELKSTLSALMKQCKDNGISVVAAGGNADTQASEVIPADLDGVISVGSTKASGETSSFNQDPNPDIYAPGENLSVLQKDGTVSTGSGTSFSSPIVAANLAQLYSEKMPNGKFATHDQAEDALMKTSVEKVTDKRFTSFSTTAQWLNAKNPEEKPATKSTTINYDLSADAMKKAVQDAGITGTAKWSTSLKNKTLNVGEKIGDLPTITLTEPAGYSISGTWVDANGKEISEDTTAPDAANTTYTFKNIKIQKKHTFLNCSYSLDTSKVTIPDGVTITLSKNHDRFEDDTIPAAGEEKYPNIVVKPDDYTIEGSWKNTALSTSTDGINTVRNAKYIYTVTKITKNSNPSTTEPAKKTVKITFKQGSNKLPEGASFNETIQEWQAGEKFDKNKFPKVNGLKNTENLTYDYYFTDSKGNAITNTTTVPDKDTTYTLEITVIPSAITKEDEQTKGQVNLIIKANDIYKAAGSLIRPSEQLKYKVDGQTYTGDSTITLSVKDGKIDHVPSIEIISPKDLTLQGVWKNAKGDILMKNSKVSGPYTLSDIAIVDEASTTNDNPISETKTLTEKSSQKENDQKDVNHSVKEDNPKTGVSGNLTDTIAMGTLLILAFGVPVLLAVKRKKYNL